MPTVTFVDFMGTERDIEAKIGDTLMWTAKSNGVPGIVGECGGCCACGTCGVFVDETWFEVVGPPGEVEATMLSFSHAAGPKSRLGCQIKITEELDGLRVRTPERQQ
ncbi:MAG: 2Fe-2S ferredoxin [Caulobacterales bacterium]